MNRLSANKCLKTPEEYVQESIGLVHTASVNNQYLQLSQNYTYSTGQTSVVLCYVTCPEAMARELRAAVDEAVQRVFAKHGLNIRKPQ
jgi:hypothetical protein